MEKTKKNLKSEERGLLIALYGGSVFTILNLILREGFSIERPIAGSIAILTTTLSAYPLFIRGMENPWKKGKQWTFLTWLIVCVIPFTVLAFVFILLIRWLMSN